MQDNAFNACATETIIGHIKNSKAGSAEQITLYLIFYDLICLIWFNKNYVIVPYANVISNCTRSMNSCRRWSISFWLRPIRRSVPNFSTVKLAIAEA